MILGTVQLSSYWTYSSQLGICCICRRGVLTEESYFLCPVCKSVFHYEHLKFWLEIKNKCPMCNIGLPNIQHYIMNQTQNPPFLSAGTKLNSRIQSDQKNQERRSRINLKKRKSFLINCPRCATVRLINIGKSSTICPVCGVRIVWRRRDTHQNNIVKDYNKIISLYPTEQRGKKKKKKRKYIEESLKLRRKPKVRKKVCKENQTREENLFVLKILLYSILFLLSVLFVVN